MNKPVHLWAVQVVAPACRGVVELDAHQDPKDMKARGRAVAAVARARISAGETSLLDDISTTRATLLELPASGEPSKSALQAKLNGGFYAVEINKKSKTNTEPRVEETKNLPGQPSTPEEIAAYVQQELAVQRDKLNLELTLLSAEIALERQERNKLNLELAAQRDKHNQALALLCAELALARQERKALDVVLVLMLMLLARRTRSSPFEAPD